MEEDIATQHHSNCLSPSSPSLAMHKHSHTIAKVKPKIRIIHIFAPEIIKTDVANFRELVQRLTGKPSPEDDRPRRKPKRSRLIPTGSSSSSSSRENNQELPGGSSSPAEEEIGMRKNYIVKEEEEEEEEELMMTWNGGGGGGEGGGFLGGFADLDGFIQELGGEFPLLPPIDSGNHHHRLLGGFDHQEEYSQLA